MFLIVFFCLALLSVPLLGGKIQRLADVRINSPWVVLLALAVQVLIVSVIPDAPAGPLAVLHVLSYALAGYFVWVNRHIAGLPIIGVGWALNALVIAANGGVMPTSPRVAEAAPGGLAPEVFENSRPLEDARLSFLGDNFALPESWPFHNVYSIGDVLIALGAFVALHWLCRSVVARLWEKATGRFGLFSRGTHSTETDAAA